MESMDYSLGGVVEVLDAVASDRCWREGQSRVKFRFLVLLAPCYCAGGGGSSVAAPGLLVCALPQCPARNPGEDHADPGLVARARFGLGGSGCCVSATWSPSRLVAWFVELVGVMV